MKTFLLGKGRGFIFLFLMIICLPPVVQAFSGTTITTLQQQTITGTISDASGPMAGVTVMVKSSSITAITDENGHFEIKAHIGEALSIEFLGYRSKEIVVNTTDMGTIVLEENHTVLKEVTINAGYYSVKQKESTGSISRITARDIETQPVTNALATMQGRMAGVDIVQTSGVPGGSFDIRIRGQNSIRADGNSPLYIIDGVPYSSETVGYSRSNVIQPFTSSPLNGFNPSEIESIEVLKNADATAIYGSRGANGVVLITTKKGKEGKTQYSAGISTGFGHITRFADLMDTRQYLEMRSEAFANDGATPGPGDYDINGTWDSNRYTDWQKELLGGTAQYTDMQAAASGGSRTDRFMLSTNIHKETTVFPGDFNYNKAGVRANYNHTSTDGKFGLNFSAGYTAQKNILPGADLTKTARTLAPNAPALYDQFGNLNYENSTWDNPLGALKGKYTATTYDLVANTLLSYAITPDLTLKSSFGFTDTRFTEARTQPSSMYDPAYMLTSSASTLNLTTTARQSWIIEPQLSWRKELGRGVAEILAGATFQQRTGEMLSQEAIGFSSNALINNLASGSIISVLLHNETLYRYQAGFGRVNYNWDKRYILNLTGRYDGSSRFGPGKQYAAFGAIGAAWLFSNEHFLEGSNFLSLGKLRASYGSSGNDQIGDYQFMDTYIPDGTNYGGVIGLGPGRLYNPDFSWETNRKFEAALELGFFKDRITLTVAGYKNRSSSQLVGIPLPATTGFSSIQSNLNATVENRGLECSLSTVNINRDGFSWITDFNISFAENRLLSFPGLEGSTYRNQLVIGQALNIKKVYEFTGIDPQTGVYQFRDFNGDGTITSNDDRKAVVDMNPDYFGGLKNRLTCKQWELDFLFQFVKQRNYAEDYNSGLPGRMSNQPVTVLDRWQEPGDNAAFQYYSTGANSGAHNRYIGSDAMIRDASFIRLKNIAVSYTIPEHWIRGVKCRIYAQAQNLLTITPYKGADPEFRFTGYLPPLRIVSTGINFTF